MAELFTVFNGVTLSLILLGSVVGIIFGAIPGLNATMAVALCLPFTYGMDSVNGISLLLALYFGGISGGLISAVLLRIPGTPGSLATVWDGGKMAENGEPGRALGIGITYSFIGNIFGIVCMALIAPQLANFASKFGPCEYFALMFFALTLISTLAEGDMTKALISGCAGLLVAMIGVAPMDNARRFTFGIPDLNNGFALISMMIGFFAITEVLDTVKDKQPEGYQKVKFEMKGLGFTVAEFVDQLGNKFRAAVVGLGIGILPGIGATAANILAYVTCKSTSKHPERFGTGSMDGIIASETSNNACCGGTMIPLVALGIPGDAVTAIVLGGLMIHGIVPGPQMFVTNGDLINDMMIACTIASIIIFVLQMGAIHFFVKMLYIPKSILLSIVACLCIVGAYANNTRVFDIYAVLVFGVLGFAFRRLKIPTAPFMLAFILENYCETYLRRGLATYGSIDQFFTRPISAIFIMIGIGSLVYRIYKNYKASKASVTV